MSSHFPWDGTNCANFLGDVVMVNVTLVCNSGQGVPRQLSVRDGTTVGEMLNVNFDGHVEDFTVSVRIDGYSEEADLDDVLEDGSRVTLAPRKVEGATL